MKFSLTNNGYTNTFAYDGAENPTTFRSVSGKTYNSDNQKSNTGFSYDGDGNPTTYNSAALTFDAENRLTSVGTTLTATYGVDSLRASSTVSGTATYYLYDNNSTSPLCEMNSTGTITATNTYGLAGLISRHTSSGSTFYEFDPQGTVVQRLNTAGSNTITSTADAFGNVANSGTVSDPFGYEAQAGYYTDQSTGLILTTFRYYDPANGRFLNRDPIGAAGGINVYGYCGNDAENGADPSGLGPAGTPWLGRSHRTDPPLPNGDLLGNDWSIFWEWVFQTGGMNRFYNADDPGTQDLRQEFGAWMSDQYAAAGAPNYYGKGIEDSIPAYLLSWSDAIFGMRNSTQEYVGGFIWYAHRLKGNRVRYTIYNQLSVYSFFLHAITWPNGGHPDRSDTLAMGNINQWFSWTTAVPPTCGKK